jgi:pimeloyl-ACP methyl ester carboxylesterase
VLARLVSVALVTWLCVSCGADDPSSPAAPPSPPAPTGTTEAAAPAFALTCTGEGRPTVVLEAGLDTGGATFVLLAHELAGTTRVCRSDRAGIDDSDPLPDDAPDPWPGSSADALADQLAAHGEQPPFVVLGWSYGGMVAQAFATRHADVTAGLVLEDSAVPEQLVEKIWDDGFVWVDGGREVDTRTTVAELSTVDLGDVPTVVLSSDELDGRLRKAWYRYHDRLTASATDAVHVEGLGSGHEMHATARDLVQQAVEAVVAAVRAGKPLGPCRRLFSATTERCLS